MIPARWAVPAVCCLLAVLLPIASGAEPPDVFSPARGPSDEVAGPQHEHPGVAKRLPTRAAGPCTTVFATRGDEGAPYETTWVAIHRWDAATRETSRARLSTADAKVLERRTWTYDAAGHVVEASVDEGGDGTVDHRERFTHDDAGRLTRKDTYGREERPLRRLERSFDEHGRLIRVELQDPFGTLAEWTSFTYDKKGRVVHEESVGWQCRTTYEGGGRKSVEWEGDEREPENEAVHSFGRRGELLRTTGRGTSTFTYDRRGLLTRSVIAGEGAVQGTTTHSYDKQGNLIRSDFTPEGAGFARDRTRYDYGCWP